VERVNVWMRPSGVCPRPGHAANPRPAWCGSCAPHPVCVPDPTTDAGYRLIRNHLFRCRTEGCPMCEAMMEALDGPEVDA
jgi:hypothetical protein